MYLVTGYSAPLLSDSESTQKINKNQKTNLSAKNLIFFKTSRNVLSPSRPVDGVKTTSTLLGEPVDLAGVDYTQSIDTPRCVPCAPCR